MVTLSIIIPVHNAGRFLDKCIKSIIGQSYRDYEIILVENGSSDDSWELCLAAAAGYPFVKALQTASSGPSLARNEGVRAASGEFIAFVDSDDTIEPGMYEDMMRMIREEDLDIVFCNFLKRYDYRGDRYVFNEDGQVHVMSGKELLEMNFLEQIPHSACTMVCRRSLFEGIEFPVGRYYEDTATTWRLIANARRAGYVARSYYHYYRHGGSIVHTPDFNIHYGHVLADMERIDFINSSPEYSQKDRLRLGARSLALFYRHFKKMVRLARTGREKDICRSCRDWALSLPKGYRLRRKHAVTMVMVRDWWWLFCILNRGGTL